MKEVFLTCGPQHTGKSFFCKKLVEENPGLIYLSRDEILIEKFGTTMLTAYGGGHHWAWQQLWGKVDHLFSEEGDLKIILDAWNGGTDERKYIFKLIKKTGADKVSLLYFKTPYKNHQQYYLKEKPIEEGSTPHWTKVRRRNGLRNCRHFYSLFHSQPIFKENIFDRVYLINPMRPLTMIAREALGLSPPA